jgi:hypothetical protein
MALTTMLPIVVMKPRRAVAGRCAVLQWLARLTLKHPYPQVGSSGVAGRGPAFTPWRAIPARLPVFALRRWQRAVTVLQEILAADTRCILFTAAAL